MRKYIVFFAVLGGLSSCHFKVNQSDQPATHHASCASYGYKVGTAEFQKCMKEQALFHPPIRGEAP